MALAGTDGVGHFNPQGALSQHRGANSLLRWVLLRSRCQFSLLDHQTLHSPRSRRSVFVLSSWKASLSEWGAGHAFGDSCALVGLRHSCGRPTLPSISTVVLRDRWLFMTGSDACPAPIQPPLSWPIRISRTILPALGLCLAYAYRWVLSWQLGG